MNGVYIASQNICGESFLNGYFYNNVFGAATSRDDGNYNNATKLESIYMDNAEVTDTIDFSSNPKMGMLALDETVIPESIGKVIANCDFTAYKTPEWMYNGYNARFYLPPTFEVEGYIKTTSADKLWAKSVTDTAYPPLRNFEKLTLELDEDFNNLEKFFYKFKVLEKLPDCITPEVVSKCTNISYAFDGCVCLSDINRLEGADIEITSSDANKSIAIRAFCDVKGPFTLGNISIVGNAKNDVERMFQNSGVTSIGNMVVKSKLKDYVGYTYVFNGATKLQHIDNLQIDTSENTRASVGGMFMNCELADYSNVHLPLNVDMDHTFDGSSLASIESIPDYKEVIRTATLLQFTFRSTQIENVPDLVIDNATQIGNMFFNCKKLREVGSITGNANITQMGYLLRECDKLEHISKISFPNMQKLKNIYSAQYMFFMSGRSNSTGQIIIDYLNLGKALAISKNEITNNAYDGMFQFFQCPTPVKINFQCDIGTIIEKTVWLGNINGLPDVETLNSFADHALTLDSAYTLKVSKNIYSLFTSEILAKLSAKNWTIASM